MNKKLYKLETARIEAGLTFEDMAAVIGKKAETYRKKENGQSRIGLLEAVKISDKLNRPVNYLFF